MNQPRILVVRGGAIGDFICTLPAIGALRERWPAAHIEILGYPHIIELANGRHYANGTRSIEARAMAGFFIPNAILDPGLRDYFASFDLVLSYLFDPDAVFADNVHACGVQQLITGLPKPQEHHAAVHYCRPLESLAIYVDRPSPRVYPSEADRQFAEKFAPGKGWVAIHPGSGSEKKNWPVEKFASLARWLADEHGVRLLMVQGEADTTVAGQFLSLVAPRPVTVAHGLKLVKLAGVLTRCSLFAGNDSGITHLAAAVGTPTVALFGPASLPIWEPRSATGCVQVVRFGDNDLRQVRQIVAEVVEAQGNWP